MKRTIDNFQRKELMFGGEIEKMEIKQNKIQMKLVQLIR